MLNLISKLRRVILIVGDIAVLYFSLWLTLYLRYLKPVNSELWEKHLIPFTIVFALWIVILFINKLYDLSLAKNNVELYAVWSSSLVWCGLVGFLFFYVTTTGISPKTIMVMDLAIFGLFLLLWRRLFNRVIVYQRFLENAVIVGASKNTLELVKEINSKPQMGLKIRAIVWPGGKEENLETGGIDIIDDLQKLKAYLQEHRVKTIIMDEGAREYPELINQLYKSLDLQVAILDLPTFAERFTGKVLIDTIGQMWFLENIKENNKQFYEVIKRVMDIFISLIILVITLAFLPLIYMIIRFSSKGPGFFMQQRTGKNGKKFMAVKFRTMYQNAEKSGPQWAQPKDPRVTGAGRWMRKTRVDEIPQLINVLRGEMSFIGPRPERPEFIEKLKEVIPFYETRLLVKPGLTGWAQINFPYGASEKDALEKLQYDLYYIKNRSFALDISILLKTIKTVLSGGGQ